MTIRHLYRSKQLTTLLNRLGHCESHSFSVELGTSIAKSLEETSSLLTTQIVRQPSVPSLFHSEFYNFDQLVNTLTGSGSIHTAHGIMMQEIVSRESVAHGGTVESLPEMPRTKDRSLNLRIQEELPDCFIGTRKSPVIPVTYYLLPGSESSLEMAAFKDFFWVILRCDKTINEHCLPDWSGFVSATGNMPKRLTTIDYFPVINHPITEYNTVQECLRYAEEASKDVGQPFAITTFDLGVCMKAFPIIWNNPNEYRDHIVLIGTFHLTCAYLKMVGKKMAGSGLADVFLEAGLIGTGSIQGVLTGRHYEKAMHCHKVVLESLERLLIQSFLVKEETETFFDGLTEASNAKLKQLTEIPSRDVLSQCLNDLDIVACVNKFLTYKQMVREGHLGKTARFCLSYMDHIWLVLSLTRAVKTNDILLYADCLHRMTDIFFSFDGQNYARYMTFFTIFLANIDQSHPGARQLLERGAFSVARSFIPSNRCAVDKTMEETFMKHDKSRCGSGTSGSGVTGIAGNYDAYQRWVTHERSKYVAATLNMADMVSDSKCGTAHKDLRPSEKRKSEQDVCKTFARQLMLLRGFLIRFQSRTKNTSTAFRRGARVPAENENDILEAKAIGRNAKKTLL